MSYNMEQRRWNWPKKHESIFGVEYLFDPDFYNKDELIKSAGFQFCCFPIGGFERFFWKPGLGEIPKPFLPDIGLSRWRNSVYGLISKWVDPDSSDEHIADISISGLIEELNNANYLAVPCVILKLKYYRSPKLANTIRYWLQDNIPRFKIWIILPTNLNKYANDSVVTTIDDNFLSSDIWSIWKLFHNSVILNFNVDDDPLCVGIRFEKGSDFKEFSDEFYLSRWRGEPFVFIWLNSASFSSKNALDKVDYIFQLQSDVLSKLADIIEVVILKQSDNQFNIDTLRCQVLAVDDVVNAKVNRRQNVPILMDALDSLQIPLQPLTQNLSSVVYETFERDAVKYKQYRLAIRSALSDIVTRKSSGDINKNESFEKIVAFVLGAGRGPLVDAVYDVYFDVTSNIFPLELWAVEKNTSATQAMELRERQRKNFHILHCDMRKLSDLLAAGEFSRPDLVVSELLGSFADNELSPECLGSVENIFHANTISIPQSYSSYLAPIHSTVLQHELCRLQQSTGHRELKGIGREKNTNFLASDCLYVAFMKRVCLLAPPLKCFTFTHPGSNLSPANRHLHNTMEFRIRCKSYAVNGFAAFFHAVLYADVTLSTCPGDETPDMLSWAPGFFPLRTPLLINDSKISDRIILDMFRIRDDNGVWYEWKAQRLSAQTYLKLNKEENQNHDGRIQYLRLK